DLSVMLELAIPLSACLGSNETTSRLMEVAKQDDVLDEHLREVFEALAIEVGLPLSALEERLAYLFDLIDLKSEFALPIGLMNAAIASLGGRYKLISNESLHREFWTRHLRQRQPVIAEKLRGGAASLFDTGMPLQSYSAARDSILDIAVDPAW